MLIQQSSDISPLRFTLNLGQSGARESRVCVELAAGRQAAAIALTFGGNEKTLN